MADEQRTGQIVTHDHKRGLSYIYLAGRLKRGGVKRTRRVHGDGDVLLDFDADGHLVGIELLRRDLLHPSLLVGAIQPGTSPDE